MQRGMLFVPGSRSLACISGARSASVHNVTPFLATNPFQWSPLMCPAGSGQHLAAFSAFVSTPDLDTQHLGADAAAKLIATP